jgi:molecular chaperone HtpG
VSAQTLPFKTELKQILDIIIHSLYSHRDIFLRELVSNASDAIDTLRFQALTDPDLLKDGGEDWKSKIIPDEKAGTLTVSDNGVGMSRDEIVENLGTIAKSGTRALLESLKQADVQSRPELIGQFGVGFYSSFMVADKVTVVSRHAGQPKESASQWESTGQGEFSIETVEKASRGTDVVLHLKEDAREFLQQWKIRELVKRHSDFVEHPIVIDVEREDEKKEKTIVEETLNSQKALWLRPKSEITAEEYNDFYKHLSHDFQDPAKVIHFAAEGAVEFKALLYLPKHKPFDLTMGDMTRGVQLYIRRVFILDDCETLLPLYFRFVRGVVDSPDLPLNVSRELLQQSAPLEKIKSNLVNKLVRTLEEMKTKEYDAYVEFYNEFGFFLKEGVSQDRANRDALAELLLIASTRTEPGKFTTLAEYVSRMPADQNEIYYQTGENREILEHSPHLESFRAKGQEVLLFTEPIDEFVVQALTVYKDKRLKAVDKGDVAGSEILEETKTRFKPLLDFMKEKLPDVKEVRLSNRLKESAVCLVSDEWSMGPHMERFMARMGRDMPEAKRTLEINHLHPAIAALQKLHEHKPTDERVERTCRLLYDEALLAEGSKIKDPAALMRTINEMVVKELAG